MSATGRCGTRPRGGGFTLLELLVAVAIFAIVAAAAYGGLSVVLSSDAKLDEHSHALSKLQLSLQLIQRDLLQASPRSARDQYGDTELAFVSGPAPERLFSLTRAGWPNPAGLPRSDLARVAYSLDGDQLLRLSWPQLDRAPGTKPTSTVILDGVDTVDLRYMDTEGTWHDQWPPLGASPDTARRPPKAVELVIEHSRWGRVRRLFGLPG